ncbi:MAG TPA: hypothetical protein VF472_23760 [Burkholderiaceae bacterium]
MDRKDDTMNTMLRQHLTPEILADMDDFQALLQDKANQSRCALVGTALEKGAATFSNWATEADAVTRKEKHMLYTGFLAAADICRTNAGKMF